MNLSVHDLVEERISKLEDGSVEVEIKTFRK